MIESGPLVSIGVAIYNEELFLRAALESLVSQDYSNIEIIISDNASTDSTGEICKYFQSQYPHIRTTFLINSSWAI